MKIQYRGYTIELTASRDDTEWMAVASIKQAAGNSGSRVLLQPLFDKSLVPPASRPNLAARNWLRTSCVSTLTGSTTTQVCADTAPSVAPQIHGHFHRAGLSGYNASVRAKTHLDRTVSPYTALKEVTNFAMAVILLVAFYSRKKNPARWLSRLALWCYDCGECHGSF